MFKIINNKTKLIFSFIISTIILFSITLIYKNSNASQNIIENKIAIVNIMRAVMECNNGKQAQLQLKQKAEVLETEIKNLATDLQNLRKELDNPNVILKPEIRLLKERDIEKKGRILSDRQHDAHQEMSEAERDTFIPIQDEILKIIKEIGIKDNYSIILNESVMFYYNQNFDITQEVIINYNLKFK